MSGRDLLASATPRPWRKVLRGETTYIKGAGAGATLSLARTYETEPHNAALIVAAVNEYESSQLWREALEIICSDGVPSHQTPYGSVRAIAAYAIGKTGDAFYRDGERLFNEARAVRSGT